MSFKFTGGSYTDCQDLAFGQPKDAQNMSLNPIIISWWKHLKVSVQTWETGSYPFLMIGQHTFVFLKIWLCILQVQIKVRIKTALLKASYTKCYNFLIHSVWRHITFSSTAANTDNNIVWHILYLLSVHRNLI